MKKASEIAGAEQVKYGIIKLSNPEFNVKDNWFYWRVDSTLIGNFQKAYFMENHLVGKINITVVDKDKTALFSESEIYEITPGKRMTIEARHELPDMVADRIYGFEASPQICHMTGLAKDERLDLAVQAEVLRQSGK